jgi:glycosyltransferase involved in cell wall biosynthesis
VARLTLCLLTWNELAGCEHDVPRLPLDQFDEVFAIDGGSTDGTIEYLHARGITVHPQDRPTYNGAYLCAFSHCTTDALVFFHPKGSIDPAAVLGFRPHFDQGADLVIASRIGSGARNEEDDHLLKHRKWFVMALGLLVSVLWRRSGRHVWDVLHGFRGMRKGAFLAIDPLPAGVSIDLEMVARAYKRRLRIATFPVEERPRLGGSTHFKAWPTGKRLLAYIWRELSRRP